MRTILRAEERNPSILDADRGLLVDMMSLRPISWAGPPFSIDRGFAPRMAPRTISPVMAHVAGGAETDRVALSPTNDYNLAISILWASQSRIKNRARLFPFISDQHSAGVGIRDGFLKTIIFRVL